MLHFFCFLSITLTGCMKQLFAHYGGACKSIRVFQSIAFRDLNKLASVSKRLPLQYLNIYYHILK